MESFFKLPAAGALFFVSAWLLMLFAGVVSEDVGVRPFGYLTSMVVTIALWLVVAPAAFGADNGQGQGYVIPGGSIEQQVADHYASCMDQPAVDAAGVATQRVVSPTSVRGGQLVAFDSASGRLRDFAIHRITCAALTGMCPPAHSGGEYRRLSLRQQRRQFVQRPRSRQQPGRAGDCRPRFSRSATVTTSCCGSAPSSPTQATGWTRSR